MAARKWLPGQSGNPTGMSGRMRGKGMVEFIGKATEDGKAIASFFVRVLKGIEKGSNVSHKIRAAEWLADRYAGKAVEIALTGDIDSPSNPLAELTADQLRLLIHKVVGVRGTPEPTRALAPAENASVSAHVHTQPAESTQLSTPEPTAADVSPDVVKQ